MKKRTIIGIILAIVATFIMMKMILITYANDLGCYQTFPDVSGKVVARVEVRGDYFLVLDTLDGVIMSKEDPSKPVRTNQVIVVKNGTMKIF